MKKSMIVFSTVCAVLSLSANTNLSTDDKAAIRKERRMQRALASGGHIEQDVKGNSALIYNAQTSISMDTLNEIALSIRQLVHIKIEAMNGSTKEKMLPTKSYPVVVSLINDKSSDATLLIAPEQNWATVNIAALLKDNPSNDVIKSRIHKEVWRATAMAMGAANSMTQPCLMRQINSLKELDNTRNMLPSPQPINNMLEFSYKYNIPKIRRVTYKKACEEGWAHAPTNDIQKAIWDKVHAMPTAPIKIKPETKKVTE